jgi:predicted aminopeptidase
VRARLLGALLLLAGCGAPAYVARLGWEEARILLRREPIPAVLARPDLAPDLRERLELVLAARTYARDDLGLDVGDVFGSFAEVDPDQTVHVVSAARRDRLEAITWWWPIAGEVPYRGFFDRADALAESRALAARDLDVDVRPAIAFSTLGWFADPLLSSTAREAPVDLVETVFHELFHTTLYVPGASAFNESAATWVGNRGAVAFFCHGPRADAPRCQHARAAWADTRARGRVLQRLARRLRALYAAHYDPRTRELLRRRLAAAAGATLQRRGLGPASLVSPPNNARLLGLLVYTTSLDAFDRLAPGTGDPGPAVRALVAGARGADRPFDVLQALVERGTAVAGLPGGRSTL